MRCALTTTDYPAVLRMLNCTMAVTAPSHAKVPRLLPYSALARWLVMDKVDTLSLFGLARPLQGASEEALAVSWLGK